jgi:hypothetical protein
VTATADKTANITTHALKRRPIPMTLLSNSYSPAHPAGRHLNAMNLYG